MVVDAEQAEQNLNMLVEKFQYIGLNKCNIYSIKYNYNHKSVIVLY